MKAFPFSLDGAAKVDSLQHPRRYEVHVLGEVLSSIQNRNHQEGDLWDKATFWRNSAPYNDGQDANGGALIGKTPTVAMNLISNMASNTQQFGIRGAGQPRMVNEIGVVDNLRLENQLTKLTSLVRQLAV
ncbi:hypothetical protein CR513_52338, partial [Mucuna pruriens]